MARLSRMFRWVATRALFAAASAALLLPACAKMQLQSYVVRDVDLSQYRGYAWEAADRLMTGDPRLDNNPFFQRRLRSDVDRQLTRRGFVESDSPDLIVRYRASVAQRVEVDGVDREFGQCQAEQCEPTVYEAGTLVVDLVDARTNRLVWRGWAKESLDGVIDDQEWLEARIDRAVERIMSQLPPAFAPGAP